MRRLPILLALLLVLLTGAAARAQRIQDASFRTVGYIKDDGTVQDASFRTIGHVRNDGTVQDAAFRTIGHTSNVPRSRTAWWFFFR